MWLAEKSAVRNSSANECVVGVVTIGGERPSVLAEGELRSAELIQTGAVRLPKIGEEVLLARTADGDCVVVGRIGGKLPAAANGEIVMCNNDALLKIDNKGNIILSGDITLTGTVCINGTLMINGQAYVPATSTDSSTTTGA